MNKKLLSTCLVLSICAVAVAPIYKQLDLNSSNTVHEISEYELATSEKISSIKKYGFVDDTVTYPQSEEKAVVLAAKTEVPASNTSIKKSTTTPTKTSTKRVTTSKSTTTSVRTTSTRTAPTLTRKATTSTPTTVNRGTTATSPKAAAVISTAKSFLGVPYVWGGQSPSGFDCSGYIQYVLGKNGISIARTSAEQYKAGVSVSRSNLRVGDLVFFSTYKPGPSHLGFYIGNGEFIHASSSKGVAISKLSNTYYASRYIGARRVIN